MIIGIVFVVGLVLMMFCASVAAGISDDMSEKYWDKIRSMNEEDIKKEFNEEFEDDFDGDAAFASE